MFPYISSMDIVRSKKGQMLAGGVAENMLALLVIVAVAYITIKVATNLETNTTAGLTGEADLAAGNFTDGLWDSYQLMALAPYLIGALVVIALVVGFARLVGVGRM